jgi:hypothetical protein
MLKVSQKTKIQKYLENYYKLKQIYCVLKQPELLVHTTTILDILFYFISLSIIRSFSSDVREERILLSWACQKELVSIVGLGMNFPPSCMIAGMDPISAKKKERKTKK